jgi:hypothetical protein
MNEKKIEKIAQYVAFSKVFLDFFRPIFSGPTLYQGHLGMQSREHSLLPLRQYSRFQN